jgi:hypothetical protein
MAPPIHLHEPVRKFELTTNIAGRLHGSRILAQLRPHDAQEDPEFRVLLWRDIGDVACARVSAVVSGGYS